MAQIGVGPALLIAGALAVGVFHIPVAKTFWLKPQERP